jgi:hypothetical protein
MFEALIAKLVGSLIFGKAKDVATKGVGLLATIPKPVWEALAVVGYVLALFFLHQHYADAALKAADAAGYERRAAEDAKVIVEMRARGQTAEANGKTISTDTRSTNDAANAGTNAAADSLLAHGPGAARCGHVSNSAVPAASGEHEPGSDRPADGAGTVLPGDDQLAAVPWNWLVGRARQADLDRSEVLAWRDWYVRQNAEWQKLKAGGGK